MTTELQGVSGSSHLGQDGRVYGNGRGRRVGSGDFRI